MASPDPPLPGPRKLNHWHAVAGVALCLAFLWAVAATRLAWRADNNLVLFTMALVLAAFAWSFAQLHRDLERIRLLVEALHAKLDKLVGRVDGRAAKDWARERRSN